MTEKVADYEALLKDLMTRVSDADANTIRGLLEKVGRSCTWRTIMLIQVGDHLRR